MIKDIIKLRKFLVEHDSLIKTASVVLSAAGVVISAVRLYMYFVEKSRMIERDRIYSPKTAGKLLGINSAEIQELIESGALRGRRTGRSYKIAGSAIALYLENN